MFTITFYSFRGGVGRTMALVNVGTWLARHGRRVLLVDFDLEAPGITSYALPGPKHPKKGVIDYVDDMVRGVSPKNLEEYFYECTGVGKDGGALFIMPSGHPVGYQARLESISFLELYEKGEGFYIMENLKELWRSDVVPDYVLIDSRTGYNEVAGICTRQLPDAVVMVFIPSPQNISGLKNTVTAIRNQNREEWRAPIKLLFLASNIPNVDDERGEVADAIARAQSELGFEELLGRVDHYISSSHLGQVVFTYAREPSGLAKTYERIAKAVAAENMSDKDGASLFLDLLLDRSASGVQGRLDDRLISIEGAHADDADLMFKLARVRLRQGLVDQALALLDNVLSIDLKGAEPRILRAHLRLQLNQTDAAKEDLLIVLNPEALLEEEVPSRHLLQVSQALLTLHRIDTSAIRGLHEFSAYRSLPTESKATILMELARLPGCLPIVSNFIEDLLPSITSGQTRSSLKTQLVLQLIATRRYDAAMELMEERPTDSSDVHKCFNYAIAEWGKTKTIPSDLFGYVVAYHESTSSTRSDANYLQCAGLAYAVVGDAEKAKQLLTAARHRALYTRRPGFSCWTYAVVDHERFAAHVDDMQSQLASGSLRPPCLK